MKSNNLQKLKERLDLLLMNKPINSQEVLYLSHKIDNLIVEYYRKKVVN